MNSNFLAILLLAFFAGEAFGQDPVKARNWTGRWSGVVRLTGGGQTTKMTLEIGQAKDGAIPWTINYGEGAKAQTRSYRLLIINEETGVYRLDEGGGLVLEAQMVGPSLHLVFQVAESTLHTRYTRTKTGLEYTTLTSKLSEERLNKRGPAVSAHRFRGYQSAQLVRARRSF